MISIWHWWIVAVVLAIVEVFTPGFIFIWLGASAFITGAILLIAPDLDWRLQILIFAVLAVASVVAWLIIRRRLDTKGEPSTLSKRGHQHIGQTFVLIEKISNGRGRVRVGDSTWVVTGPDLPKGKTVLVTGVDGAILQVIAADSGASH